MQASAVDTEHVLLGLFTLDENRIAHLLAAMGANAQTVRAETTNAVANYPQGQKHKEPVLTSLAKRTLELAVDEARRMRHNYIGTGHLLLALLREERGRASQILLAQGVGLEKTRSVLMELAESQQSAKPSQIKEGDEQQLLSLLERRADLLVEILGLDVLALKKARLELSVRLDRYEEAALLRDEIENEHS